MPSLSILHLVLFGLLAASASSTYISRDVLESHRSSGRSLRQQGNENAGMQPEELTCPVMVENANFTIITSQCIGPNYLPKPCCGSFKQVACPYSEQLNDKNTDCALILFSNINYYGNYPIGLFAKLCHEGPEGLSCDEVLNAIAKKSSTVHDKKSSHGKNRSHGHKKHGSPAHAKPQSAAQN